MVDHLDSVNEDKLVPLQVLSNIIALKVAQETSFKLIESNQIANIDLIYFLGCLPGGVAKP